MNEADRDELIESIKDELGEQLDNPDFWRQHLDAFVRSFARFEGVDYDDLEAYPVDSYARQEAFKHTFDFWLMEIQNELVQDDDWREAVTSYIWNKYGVKVSEWWPTEVADEEEPPEEAPPEEEPPAEPDIDVPSVADLNKQWGFESKEKTIGKLASKMSKVAKLIDKLLEIDDLTMGDMVIKDDGDLGISIDGRFDDSHTFINQKGSAALKDWLDQKLSEQEDPPSVDQVDSGPEEPDWKDGYISSDDLYQILKDVVSDAPELVQGMDVEDITVYFWEVAADAIGAKPSSRHRETIMQTALEVYNVQRQQQ